MRFTRVFLLVVLFALVAVPAAFAIRFTDDSYNMPVGTVGQPYSKTFYGAGGCGPALPYQFTVISGALPPGLSLSFSGTISGTPTAAGSFSFYVNLSDQNPPSADWCRPAEAQREFTIVINGGAPAVPLTIDQAALTPSVTTVGSSYSMQLSASGGGTQTWSVVGGSLPGGLQLSASGLISGKPSAAGDFNFNVRVSDGTRSATHAYSMSVVQPLKIAPVTVPPAEVGVPFALTPTVVGGKAGYTWSAANLPAGVAIDAATGRLSGSPSTPGSFPVKLTVRDSLGLTDTIDVTLVFAPKLAIKTIVQRTGKVGRPFVLRLAATGGVEPRTWRILRGALPPGMRFSRLTGAFSGTPRHSAKKTLALQVTDRLGGTALVTLTLRIRP